MTLFLMCIVFKRYEHCWNWSTGVRILFSPRQSRGTHPTCAAIGALTPLFYRAGPHCTGGQRASNSQSIILKASDKFCGIAVHNELVWLVNTCCKKAGHSSISNLFGLEPLHGTQPPSSPSFKINPGQRFLSEVKLHDLITSLNSRQLQTKSLESKTKGKAIKHDREKK